MSSPINTSSLRKIFKENIAGETKQLALFDCSPAIIYQGSGKKTKKKDNLSFNYPA
jgi:hypothetical protein